MLTAKITISSGQNVVLQGSPAEIGAALASLGNGPAPVRRGLGSRPKSVTQASGVSLATAAPKARKPVSAATAKARKLQGQYMGTLRGLVAADKKRVQAVAKEKGVAEALKVAQSIAPKAAPKT